MNEESTDGRIKLSRVNDVMVENLVESHLRKVPPEAVSEMVVRLHEESLFDTTLRGC